MKTTYSINIDAPQNKVFNCVDDDNEVKKWVDGLEETSYPDGINRMTPVGTKFKQKIREKGKIKEYEGEVIKYDKPHLLAIRLYDKMFDVEVTYRFIQIPTGTRLDYEADITFKSWFGNLMGKLFSGMGQNILVKQMNQLKKVAETNG